jgi:hypothetical protein
MRGPAQGVLREEPSASITHARVCEGRGRRRYDNPYSGTKPETVDTRQGAAYGCDRSSPTRKLRNGLGGTNPGTDLCANAAAHSTCFMRRGPLRNAWVT